MLAAALECARAELRSVRCRDRVRDGVPDAPADPHLPVPLLLVKWQEHQGKVFRMFLY